MEINIKDNLLIIKKRDMEYKLIKMEKFIKDNGFLIKEKEKEHLII
jgi:hypothetical protein